MRVSGLWVWVLLVACQRTDAVRADGSLDARAGADAGLDADGGAAPDAGRADAGPVDAAEDVSRPPGDAGRADAAEDGGPPDGAPRDAGSPDAGSPDAGRPDAGRPDAAPPDAGLFDAGLLDAAPESAPGFLALGDSYTIGTGVEPEARWPAQVVASLRAEGVAVADPRYLAQNGWTTFALNAALDREAPVGPFALVTLLIGVNDQFFHETPLAYQQRFEGLLERAVDLAGDAVCRVIVLSIPDYSVTPFGRAIDPARITREIAEFNRVNRAVAEARGVRYVDVTPSSLRAAEDPGLLAEDGLHPSARMYAEWAGLVLPEARAGLACAVRP